MSFLFLGTGDLFLLEGLFTRVVYSGCLLQKDNKIYQQSFSDNFWGTNL